MRAFLRRMRGESFADLEAVVRASRKRLLESLVGSNASDNDRFDAINHFETCYGDVLLEKLRKVLREYVKSGTDFSLASGRLWAASKKRAEYMQLLCGSADELKHYCPNLAHDLSFTSRLLALRRELQLESSYREVRNVFISLRKMQAELGRHGLIMNDPYPQNPVHVILEREMSVDRLLGELLDSILGAGPGLESRLQMQLGNANPELFSVFETASRLGANRVALPPGTRVELSATDFGWELQRICSDLQKRILSLIIDAQVLAKDAAVRLMPRAEQALYSLSTDLDKLGKNSPAESQARLNRQVIMQIAGRGIEEEDALEYLRKVALALNKELNRF